MHELRACDFCGADAVGTFEVVPPEFDPTEAEQRRVVLCSDCRTTLEAVLEPFFARLSDDDASSESTPDHEVEPSVTSERSSAAAEASDETESLEDATAPVVDTTTPVDDPASDESDAADEADQMPTDQTPTDDPLGNGVTFASDPKREPDDADELHAESPSEGTDPDAETDPDADHEGRASTENEAEVETKTDDAATTEQEPDEFRTVMRLLANREFPVERDDVESLAFHAYDIDAAQVDEILGYAVERGVLEEDGSQLKRA